MVLGVGMVLDGAQGLEDVLGGDECSVLDMGGCVVRCCAGVGVDEGVGG